MASCLFLYKNHCAANDHHTTTGPQVLIDWIVDYFSVKETADTNQKNAFDIMKKPQITITEKMPIILQHDRHSRTIIGYEIDKNGALHLLTFDPSL